MAENRSFDLLNRSNDSDSANLLNKKNKHHVSPDENDHPRKRSSSLVHWVQKPFTYVKERRKRSETTMTPHTVSHLVGTSTDNQKSTEIGRPRAWTTDSVEHKEKKTRPPKKLIADTDPRAHQSISVSQFVFAGF